MCVFHLRGKELNLIPEGFFFCRIYRLNIQKQHNGIKTAILYKLIKNRQDGHVTVNKKRWHSFVSPVDCMK